VRHLGFEWQSTNDRNTHFVSFRFKKAKEKSPIAGIKIFQWLVFPSLNSQNKGSTGVKLGVCKYKKR